MRHMLFFSYVRAFILEILLMVIRVDEGILRKSGMKGGNLDGCQNIIYEDQKWQ